MKKLFTIALMLIMLFSFVGCNKDDDKKENPKDDDSIVTPNPDKNNTSEDATISDYTIASDTKVYLTTIGQSDFDTVLNLLTMAGKEDVVANNLLEASAVEKGSVVILVTGSSTKGLGSAGTDIGKENQRASAFAAAAEAGDFKLIVVHVGKAARRGEQADPIIRTVTPKADLVMVVSEGNSDGKFTEWTAQGEGKLYQYSRATKMLESFKAIFGL